MTSFGTGGNAELHNALHACFYPYCGDPDCENKADHCCYCDATRKNTLDRIAETEASTTLNGSGKPYAAS